MLPDQDLLCLGRPLEDSIIVDNSPHSYVFQPENALPIGTFIDDPHDREVAESPMTFVLFCGVSTTFCYCICLNTYLLHHFPHGYHAI